MKTCGTRRRTPLLQVYVYRGALRAGRYDPKLTVVVEDIQRQVDSSASGSDSALARSDSAIFNDQDKVTYSAHSPTRRPSHWRRPGPTHSECDLLVARGSVRERSSGRLSALAMLRIVPCRCGPVRVPASNPPPVAPHWELGPPKRGACRKLIPFRWDAAVVQRTNTSRRSCEKM